MPEFRLRDGTANDIGRVTDITLSALKSAKDSLFAYNCPHSHEYPDDNRYYWNLRLEPAAYKRGAKFLVVEMEDESQGEKKVIAWCKWQWNLAAQQPAPQSFPKDTIGKAIARMYISMRTGIIEYIYPRRDADLAHYQAFFAAADEADKKYWKDLYPNSLFLSGFYTDPEYQGQGAGRMLMQWGIQTAAAAQCVIGLSASNERAAEIYRHWGFQDIGTRKAQSEGDEAYVEMPVLLYIP